MVKEEEEVEVANLSCIFIKMESHDYEHYRNLTLMFFFEKLLEKGGE